MAVTIKDVAKLAGVSTATVSHVMGNTRFVSGQTKQKVVDAAHLLGYVPNANASGLRSKKSRRIGLLVPEISSIFSSDITRAVEQVFLKSGYQLIFGCSHESLEMEKEQINVFLYQQVEGLLMFPAPGDHSYLNTKASDLPIVFIDRAASNCERDLFIGNNEAATHDAVSIMIREGHSRIGLIDGTPGVSALAERVSGYKRALAEHNIETDEMLVQQGDSTISGAYLATERILKDPTVTAILPLSPTMTIGCFKCLVDKKIKIPEQIALLSFGDSEWANITCPPLSALRHPLFEMGQRAAQRLLERLKESDERNPSTSILPYETVRFPIELIRRNTF